MASLPTYLPSLWKSSPTPLCSFFPPYNQASNSAKCISWILLNSFPLPPHACSHVIFCLNSYQSSNLPLMSILSCLSKTPILPSFIPSHSMSPYLEWPSIFCFVNSYTSSKMQLKYHLLWKVFSNCSRKSCPPLTLFAFVRAFIKHCFVIISEVRAGTGSDLLLYLQGFGIR